MEFLQKNARAIIIALLAAGVVVAISASGDNNNEETANQESSEVASTTEVDGPLAPSTVDEAEAVSDNDPDDVAVVEDEAVEEEQTETDSAEDESSEDTAVAENDSDEAVETDAETEENTTEPTGDVVRTNDDYTVAAAAGDSQTTLMRKLIAQYESENDVQLTAPQRLYAETNLVDDIGQAESIEVGSEVKLSGADIKIRVEEARNLSEAKLALWSQYL